MKTCPCCKGEKELAEFQKNKTTKDGLQTWCRVCRKKICAEYVRKNREKVNAWARDHAKRNHEKVTEATRKWRPENISYVAEYNRLYLKKHSEKRGARNRTEAKELADNYIYRLLVPVIGVNRKDISKDMIEAKRAHLQIARKLKELKA